MVNILRYCIICSTRLVPYAYTFARNVEVVETDKNHEWIDINIIKSFPISGPYCAICVEKVIHSRFSEWGVKNISYDTGVFTACGKCYADVDKTKPHVVYNIIEEVYVGVDSENATCEGVATICNRCDSNF